MVYNSESSLDTNLLLRFLLGDVPAQTEKVVALLSREDCLFFVSDVIFVELVHVLSNVLAFSRPEVRALLSVLFKLKNLSFQSPFLLELLDFYIDHPSLSFVDCYSAFLSESLKKESLLTFDKKLSSQSLSAKLLD